MSCMPCDKTVRYENRRLPADSECQKKLAEVTAELEKAKKELESYKCGCPIFKIESITRVGKEVLVMFDNYTYTKAPLAVVDESLLGNKDIVVKPDVSELVRKDELVDIPDLTGKSQFKAYPADTPSSEPTA